MLKECDNVLKAAKNSRNLEKVDECSLSLKNLIN